MLVNAKDVGPTREDLKKAGVAEDPATGVYVVACEHDGGALRRQSAVYAIDGSKTKLHFRQLATVPADQLPAAAP